ncbi:YcgL domain-containing protein [Ectopseudomonas oleovorans]|uniref:Uncharacterized protein n=1 Tax=Ectopseudomonas oleovorans TaxID=301 RepID=A0A653B6D5_ECTOL|nr:YcgL domain-containing protein [Pseudomonas oleovorans]
MHFRSNRNPMDCDIYKAISHKDTYLFVEKGNRVSDKVSEKLLKKIGQVQHLKSISFDENSPLIAANPKEVINNIQTQGFHIQGAEIKIEDNTGAGAAIGGGILAASLGLGPAGAIIGAVAGYLLANASKEGKK